MLESLIKFFNLAQVHAPEGETRSAQDHLFDGYAHAGMADVVALPTDRLGKVRVRVIGCDGEPDKAHDVGLAFNDFIQQIRATIRQSYGGEYGRWFTHSVLYFEADVRGFNEGAAPVIRIIYRDEYDQRLGSLIIREIWDAIQEINPSWWPQVSIANCHLDLFNEDDPGTLDYDYRIDAGNGEDSPQRAIRLATANV